MESSYSQLGQDRWVLSQTTNKRGGYFVEAGACDGVELSNTYLLEKDYNWRGICCEPNADFHPSLRANRKCHVDGSLLYDSSGDTQLFHKAGIFGGTQEDFKVEEDRLSLRLDAVVEEVSTLTLNDLLDKYNAPPLIDYISLDTEGSEMKILSAFDFGAREVGLWTIEHNSRQRRDGGRYLHSIIDLMQKNGYKALLRDWDVWFYKSP
mgnify:CR=1 FL=1